MLQKLQKDMLKGSIEDKLDTAYAIYIEASRPEVNEVVLKNEAIQFMKTVFNAKSDEELIARMEKRNETKEFAPFSIPGRSPNVFGLNKIKIDKMKINEEKKKQMYKYMHLIELASAFEDKKIIGMTRHGFEVDQGTTGKCWSIRIVDDFQKVSSKDVGNRDMCMVLKDNKITAFWWPKEVGVGQLKSKELTAYEVGEIMLMYSNLKHENDISDVKLSYEHNPSTDTKKAINKFIGEVAEKTGYFADKKTVYLTSEETAKYRTLINDGKFYILDNTAEAFQICDTEEMESKRAKGFAAYTINKDGGIAIFSHKSTADGLAHSSMNAGAPVIFAGELKIEEGVLKEINTFSGHYKPSIENVYYALKYLQEQGVDITNVKINSFAEIEGPNRVLILNKNIDIAKIPSHRADTIIVQLKDDKSELLTITYYNKENVSATVQVDGDNAKKIMAKIPELSKKIIAAEGVSESISNDQLMSEIKTYITDCNKNHSIGYKKVNARNQFQALDIMAYGEQLTKNRADIKKEARDQLLLTMKHSFSQEAKNATLSLIGKLKEDADELITELNAYEIKHTDTSDFKKIIISIMEDWGVELYEAKDINCSNIVTGLKRFSEDIKDSIGKELEHEEFAKLLIQIDMQKDRVNLVHKTLFRLSKNEAEKIKTSLESEVKENDGLKSKVRQ